MVTALDDWMLSTIPSAMQKSPEYFSLVVMVLPLILVTIVHSLQPSWPMF